MFVQAFLLLGYAITSVSAQYVLDITMGSCADIDYPHDPDTNVKAKCQVTNRIYSQIGSASLDTAITAGEDNITWTVAYGSDEHADVDELRRMKDLYLGTPPSLDLNSDDLPY